jgi:hypothetical protein
LRGLPHGLSVLDRECDGLLTKHVLAGARRSFGIQAVQVVRYTQVHARDRCIAEHFRIVPVHTGAELPAEDLGANRVSAPADAQLHVLMPSERTSVQPAYISRAD